MTGKRRILVVDDDVQVRNLVRITLEQAGYEVTAARNGSEAIQILAASDFDVILLDVVMPKIDGLEVVERLRKESSPVLAHTYLLTAGDSDSLVDLPVRGVITKPFDVGALVAETKDCIGH